MIADRPPPGKRPGNRPPIAHSRSAARDALDVRPATGSSFATRSLLLADDPGRALAIPVFFRPNQVSYHAPLAKWTRVDVRGTFAELGREASLDLGVLLSRRARIALRAGRDLYATARKAEGLLAGRGAISSAWIEIDGRRIGKVQNEGLVALSDASGRFRVRRVEDARAGLAELGAGAAIGSSFIAAVGVPRRLVSRHFRGAPPATSGDEPVNCAFVASDRSRPASVSRCGSGDIEIALEWR